MGMIGRKRMKELSGRPISIMDLMRAGVPLTDVTKLSKGDTIQAGGYEVAPIVPDNVYKDLKDFIESGGEIDELRVIPLNTPEILDTDMLDLTNADKAVDRTILGMDAGSSDSKTSIATTIESSDERLVADTLKAIDERERRSKRVFISIDEDTEIDLSGGK